MKGLILLELLGFGVTLYLTGRWRNARDGKGRGTSLVWVGLALVAATFVLGKCWITVPPASVVAVYDPLRGGIQTKDLGEGWHLIAPWASTMPFSVRTQAYTMSGLAQEGADAGHEDEMTCQTSEGLGLSIDATVLFHISPGDANRLWKSVGPNYVAVIVRPVVREAARIIIAQYPVMSVYSNAPAQTDGIPGVDFFPGRRQEVSDLIAKRVDEALRQKGITLERFLLRNVDFTSPEFERAIVDKQVAQQRIVTQQYEAEIQHVRAQANVVRAEGDAEAIRLKGNALAVQPKVIQWEMVEKLPDDLEVMILPDKSMPIIGFNQPLASRTYTPQAEPAQPPAPPSQPGPGQ